MSRRLWQWFPKLLSEPEARGIVVHLGDLYGASAKLRSLVARLPRIPVDNRVAARRALLDVQVELYDHMWAHMTELRAALQDGIERLYDDAPHHRRGPRTRRSPR